MQKKLPKIIQGGMGAGVSSWHLARAVSETGQLGVVSGTGLGPMLARRLQEGDASGSVRRALRQFPFRAITQRIIDTYFVEGGKPKNAPYPKPQMDSIEGNKKSQELNIAGNFVEVFLAREGHNNPVGINYLEKIQLPHLPSIYGAMLAGVAVIIMGAGIPIEVPGILDELAQHHATKYPVVATGSEKGEIVYTHFDPKTFIEESAPLKPLHRPAFYPIVSSRTLASMLCKRATGSIEGLIVEFPTAGGHNAPPRGKKTMSESGEPVYGKRDEIDITQIKKLGLPIWLAGSYGTPDKLKEALAVGAEGVQIGTPFALCMESGLVPAVRDNLVKKCLNGSACVFTDPDASPTGFPFKVALINDSLSNADVYNKRERVCDIGLLREVYRKPDGSLGYRCPAEPEAVYEAKGGDPAATTGRKCLCNALVSNVGMPQVIKNGDRERMLVTLGDDLANIGLFCSEEHPYYSAADVINVMLAAPTSSS